MSSGDVNFSSANENANYLLTKVEEVRVEVEEARVGEGFTFPTIATGSVAGSFVGAVTVDASGNLRRVIA